MQLVYFGKKRPKKVTLSLVREGASKNVEVLFEPFKATDVDDDFGSTLLMNAGDIFKRYDVERSAPDPKPKVATKGFVGDKTAEQIKDLDAEIAKEAKIEEGRDADDVLAEEQRKVVNKRETRKKQDAKRKADNQELLKKEKLI